MLDAVTATVGLLSAVARPALLVKLDSGSKIVRETVCVLGVGHNLLCLAGYHRLQLVAVELKTSPLTGSSSVTQS